MSGASQRPLVPRGLLAGVTIVLVGAVLLADSFGLIDARSGWDLWPIAVIVAGLAVWLQPDIADHTAGAVLVIAGGWLLFNELGVWTYSFWRLWPLILIALGAWMRYRLWDMQRLGERDRAGTFAFLSIVDERAHGRPVTGVELSAIAAGCTFEFERGNRDVDPIVADVFIIGGRIRLSVPEDWTVELRVLPLPGRVADARTQALVTGTNRPADLVVRGTAILGAIEVVGAAGVTAPIAAPPAAAGAA